jgi:serine protease Do
MPGHRTAGAGSGVIVDPSGVILTNNHVVAGGGQVTVRLQDGREFKAVDIKADPKTDLAVLRIHGAGSLPAARLGQSSVVEVGDWVLALGQPFGLEGTVTAGIVSAKGRGLGITDREEFIQTDAAINPGNSGGPLVNLDGEVIGINTAISTNTGGYQGVGFAIPIDLAKWVGGELETAGKVHRAYLGVVIQPVTQPLAEQFKVKVHEGVLVTEVQPNTPAAKAGLRSGDVILDFSGKAVSSPRELQGLVEMAKIGSSQPLTVLREGNRMTLQALSAEQPGDFGLVRTGGRGGETETSRFEKLGIQVEDLTPQVAQQLGIKAEHGVAITDVRSGGLADLAGLANGMVITEVNRQGVKSVADFRRALDARPLDKGVLLLVQTAEGNRFVVLRGDVK